MASENTQRVKPDGLPFRTVTAISGPPRSGKTTLALLACAATQKAGGSVAFIDLYHELDLGRARDLGADTARLIVSQPPCGEDALEIVEILARSGEIDLIVIDSFTALCTKIEDQSFKDQLEENMKRVGLIAHRTQTALVLVHSTGRRSAFGFTA